MKMICQKKLECPSSGVTKMKFFFSTDQVKLSALGGYTPAILSKGTKDV